MSSLLHAARSVEGRMEEALGAAGLSAARYGVLEQLALADGPLPLSELAARLSCVRSNMTQLVDRLEAEGLVRRVHDASDRRCVRAELTPLGRQRQEAGAEQLRAVRARFEASLSAVDRDAFERALSTLA